MSLRGYLYLAVALAVLAIGSCIWIKGGSKPRAEVKTAKAEIKAVAKSNKISTETNKRVDVQGAEVRARTKRAQEVIRERIREVPAPVGPADPDILRIAQQAHQSAIRAACRVQRTSDCPAATGTDRQ